ncbi:MAG: glycosyltransferase [Campylobacterota bacterium]|nr:glycosyltransferase [Campylobacterota bacterium]
MNSKKTLLITSVAFFRASIGCMQRVKRMLEYLNTHTDLKVLFLGRYLDNDTTLIKNMGFEHIVDNINDTQVTQQQLDETPIVKTKHLEKFYYHEYKVRLKSYLEKNHFDNLMIEYITLDYLLIDHMENYTTIVDTHDLMSSRTASYKEHHQEPSIAIESLDEEVKILSRYDYVVSIQQNEYDLLNTKLPIQKNILAPHAMDINNLYKKTKKVTNIVFVSGPANSPHIVWFIENVWKYFESQLGLKLYIYGNVIKNLKQYNNIENINLIGFVEDLEDIYKDAHIVINPVHYGSGLKIKNVEALCLGIPLITTTEGANGIENGINKAFLLANSVDEWINALISVIISHKLRDDLSNKALAYSKEHFGDQKCYGKLAQALNGEL